MTTITIQPLSAPSKRFPDLPLIALIVLAYTIAWGVFGLLALIARQSALASSSCRFAGKRDTNTIQIEVVIG
jgi:hypothetical protein